METFFYLTRFGFLGVELRLLGEKAMSVPVRYVGPAHPYLLGAEGVSLEVEVF